MLRKYEVISKKREENKRFSGDLKEDFKGKLGKFILEISKEIQIKFKVRKFEFELK